MVKLGAKELRKKPPTQEELKRIKRNPIYLVLDGVIDTYNIGSLFRLADAIAAQKIYLCGEMEYPPSSRIHKAAVGTEAWVAWEKVDEVTKLLKLLRNKGVQIIAVEQHPKSIAYTDLRGASSTYSLLPNALRFPCAIVVGNETQGISKDILGLADIIVELPMYGVNKSFNVWGATAVVAYKILEFLPTNN